MCRKNISERGRRWPIQKQHESVCTIVGADPKAGEFGIAVASSALAVGKNVPFTGAFVGAMAVQGFTSPYFGITGMKLLREGLKAQEVIDKILAEDILRDARQILVIDAAGKAAAFTGGAVEQHAGSRDGENFVAGGCGLPGQEPIDAAAEAFASSQGDLAGRLVAALSAADAKSPDGTFVSAVVRVSKDNSYPSVDLRVDKHSDPVKELARLLQIWRTRSAPSA